MTSLLDVCVESSDGLALRREVRIGETHDGETAFYGNDGETCIDPTTGEVIVFGSSYLAVGDKLGTVSAFNADFHANPGNGYSFKGDRIDPNHHSYPMSVVVSNGKTKDNTKTKANLNVTEDENIISLDGAVTVFKRGKANLSVIDRNTCISAVYYNGKEICRMSQLKELWELSGIIE